MKEVLVIIDRYSYSGSQIAAVVKANDDELPHITFEKWVERHSKILEKDKDLLIKSYDFMVQNLQEV